MKYGDLCLWITLGEFRNIESAEIAFTAALTGHFVLTSLHTDSMVSV
jgi:type II secretory ATPase GspE/PulE/Tfp pilus assembly ATPase PilB-like protein